MSKEFLSEYKDNEGKKPEDKKWICPLCGIQLATLKYYSCGHPDCPCQKYRTL